jgi:hypothetical protein
MHSLATLTVGVVFAALAGSASAQSTSAPERTQAGTQAVAAPQKTPDPAWPKAAASDKLDGLRGGADTVTTQATLNGTVADNSARNVVTGNNVIDNGSFANMNGLPMVIQNTGANVLIQNATVINLQLR